MTSGSSHSTHAGPGELATWLRCPRCERDLDSAGTAGWSLSCSAGHSYDANKRGYLNTVDRSRGILGDTAPILQARQRFLDAGHYAPIADAIVAALPNVAGLDLLDSGCGTGYYLAAVLEHRPDWRSLALDVSVDAVAAAVRQSHGPGLVADVWRPLPVRDDRADVILCVFAPRNAAEFARVLRPGGRLVVVTPAADHLIELREAGRIIGIQENKLAHLDAAMNGQLTLDSRSAVAYDVSLSAEDVQHLAGMGPSGHHESTQTISTQTLLVQEIADAPELPRAAVTRDELTSVRVAVDVSVYRRAAV